MKDTKKTYWKGLEQLTNNPDFVKNNEGEFPEYMPINSNRADGGEGGPSRRDFLKMMGFGLAAASLAACEAPVKYAIPYLNKPVDVDPTIPNFYASTYAMDGDYCSIVVKTREGRPIKVEGNRFSSITEGGTSARVEASVLDLYDGQRLAYPVKKGGEQLEWAALDQAVMQGLRSAGNVRVISHTVMSPSTQAAIDEFTSRYGAEHIAYDSYSSYALIEANRSNFGKAAVPSYDFSKADVIVSIGADFLGTWLSPVEFNKQYSKTRKLSADKKEMSRHYQFESVMTVSGANADYRTPIKPSEEAQVVAALYQMVKGGKAGAEFKYLAKAARDLRAAKGKSLVVSSSNDVAVQRLVNAINQELGAFGTTIDMAKPAYYRQGNDQAMQRFIQDANAGRVDAVIFYDCNPVYDSANGLVLGEALQGGKVKLSVSTADRIDETGVLCDFIAPDHHYLESWNDYMPKEGMYSLSQPAIRPIFNTRQAQESFLTWSGNANADYFNYMKNQWQGNMFGQQTEISDFQQFWDSALYTGVFVPGKPMSLELTDYIDNKADDNSSEAAEMPAYSGGNESADLRTAAKAVSTQGVELVVYQKTAIGNGRMANNPWLQEMPDPVTKATWDNYLTIPMSMAKEIGAEMKEGDTKFAKVTIGGEEHMIPVLIQPGQARGTVGLALGYGRTMAGKVADKIGINAYPFVQVKNNVTQYWVDGVNIELTDEKYRIAQTQTHNTYMGRETIIQESTLPEYQENPMAGRFVPTIATAEGAKDPQELSLWDGHIYPNHHWAMVIDLNSCTGCGACTISCHAENNVPVVGKEEVLMRREMHWMRIDRYYSSDADVEDLDGLEVASENPEVVFQPMFCQHCNNAPCETVCPVVATTHSSEGLNQMTYNRCIGTRYCANNCPYKVRRFNWFKYHDNEQFATNTAMNSDLGKMVLNPDVTVRSRGVMEKCSFCVQRIQLGKLQAKKESRRPQDGEITTACQTSCPADAILFGDLNDENSAIRKLLVEEEQGRAYNVLREIGVRPNVFYLTKIRNKDTEEEVTA